jgi:drug/metabolite transporter (DMT)-like permease
MNSVTLVFLNVALLVAGQVVWKIGLTHHSISSIHSYFTLIKNPYIISGCLLYGIATLLWFYALSRYPLSQIYPMQSIAYVLGALSGFFFFKEEMSLNQWGGLGLILMGVYLMSNHSTQVN